MPTLRRPSRARPPAGTDTLRLRGFLRVQLVNTRTGAVDADKWVENAVTAEGYQHYVVGRVGGITGSKLVSHMQLATQTSAPSSSQTSASGEFEARESTSNTFVTPGTLQMTAQWATNEGNASVIGAVALYNTSSGGTAASVATFATSQKTTDQVFNVTYQWRFA